MGEEQKGRLPLRVVECADYTVTVNGEEYHPHAGETVTFSGGVTWPQMQRAFKLQAMLGEDWDLGKVEQYYALFDEAVKDLCGSIVAWTWTNAYSGEPYASPPSQEEVLRLDMREIQYLVRQFNRMEVTQGEDEPSTSS